MTRTQKMWLWVSLGMFLIPELLWSPVMNVIFDLFQNSNHAVAFRQNFLTNSQSITGILVVMGVQFVGLLTYAILVAKNSSLKKSLKVLFLLILSILLLVTGLAFYTIFSLRHGIGF